MAHVGMTLTLVGLLAMALHLWEGGGLEREVTKRIQEGDHEQASALLAAARKEGADAVLLDKLRGHLACAQERHAECLEHYALALEGDAMLSSDETIRSNTLRAFEHADRRWLVAKVAARLEGVDDALLQHATDMRYWIRWNAVRALEERGLEDRIPYGEVYGLDVLHAATCSTRQRSLRRLVHKGDPGARPYLLEAKARADKKFFGDGCLGSDLDKAIRSLEARN